MTNGISYYSGSVGIGETAPQYKLDVAGNANFDNDIIVNGVTVGTTNISTNTVLGYQALLNNSGFNNIASGYQALLNNSSGSDNVASGYKALLTNSSGYSNVAIGSEALKLNTTGLYNTAVGTAALQSSTTDNYKTAIGYYAGSNDTNGVYNTFLGASTSIDNSSKTYKFSTAIGRSAIIDASNQIVLGGLSTLGYYPSIYIPGSYLGIGVYNPTSGYALDVSGNVNATTYNSTSDYRIKENVTLLDESFTVDNLKPVTYTNTRLGKQDVGFIAHEIEDVYPFLVNGTKDGDNLQSVNYIGLIGILTKEIQELKERVKILENK